MVIAPGDAKPLLAIADQLHADAFPHASHRHSWATATGARHGALVSREPGSEGSDWSIAEIASKQRPDVTIYTAWFDDERAQVYEWRSGKRVKELDRDPTTFVRELGFEIDAPTPSGHEPGVFRSVAVVQGATLDEVQPLLSKHEDPVTASAAGIGVLVHAPRGELFMLPFDLSVALPQHTVYEVQRVESEYFCVSVLQGGEELGVLQLPSSDPDDELPDILGERTRDGILAKLGIEPSLLGYDDVG